MGVCEARDAKPATIELSTVRAYTPVSRKSTAIYLLSHVVGRIVAFVPT